MNVKVGFEYAPTATRSTRIVTPQFGAMVSSGTSAVTVPTRVNEFAVGTADASESAATIAEAVSTTTVLIAV
jgi:hypothetical protein